MVFLLDDGFGLDPVQQFGEGRFDVLADIPGHHQEEQVVAGFEQALLGLGDDGENAGALFHLAADFAHFLVVMADAHGADRRVVLAGPAAHHAVVHKHHAHVFGEAGAGFEFLKSFVNIHEDRLG